MGRPSIAVPRCLADVAAAHARYGSKRRTVGTHLLSGAGLARASACVRIHAAWERTSSMTPATPGLLQPDGERRVRTSRNPYLFLPALCCFVVCFAYAVFRTP